MRLTSEMTQAVLNLEDERVEDILVKAVAQFGVDQGVTVMLTLHEVLGLAARASAARRAYDRLDSLDREGEHSAGERLAVAMMRARDVLFSTMRQNQKEPVVAKASDVDVKIEAAVVRLLPIITEHVTRELARVSAKRWPN